MSLDYTDILKQGYVMMKSKLGVWQKRWVVLRKQSSKGVNRMEKFKTEAQANTSTLCKCIELDEVKDISRLPTDVKKNGFVILFAEGTSRQFGADSTLEADDWTKQLKELVFGPGAQGTLPRGTLQHPQMQHAQPMMMQSQPMVMQSQPMQQGMMSMARTPTLNPNEQFHVFLVSSAVTELCGEGVLQVTPENLTLLNPKTNTKVVAWPLNALRRYGKEGSKFSIEAGRRCDTGEGVFVFNTQSAEVIYHKVHTATQSLARLQGPKKTVDGGMQMNMGRSPMKSPAEFQGPPRSPPPLPPPRSNPSDHDDGIPLGGSASSFNGNTNGVAGKSRPDSEVEYAEKYLEPEFRDFLEDRKNV